MLMAVSIGGLYKVFCLPISENNFIVSQSPQGNLKEPRGFLIPGAHCVSLRTLRYWGI